MLFTLRGVDHLELIAETTQNLTAGLAAGGSGGDGGAETLDEGSLSEVFGIEMEPVEVEPPRAPAVVVKDVKKPKPGKRVAVRRKAAKSSPAVSKKATRPAAKKRVVKSAKTAATPKKTVKGAVVEYSAKKVAKVNKRKT